MLYSKIILNSTENLSWASGYPNTANRGTSTCNWGRDNCAAFIANTANYVSIYDDYLTSPHAYICECELF